MEAGKYVKVYFDPLTEQYVEGDDKLIRQMDDLGKHNGRKLEKWKVRFRGETGLYNRNILMPEAQNTDGSSISSSLRETDL